MELWESLRLLSQEMVQLVDSCVTNQFRRSFPSSKQKPLEATWSIWMVILKKTEEGTEAFPLSEPCVTLVTERPEWRHSAPWVSWTKQPCSRVNAGSRTCCLVLLFSEFTCCFNVPVRVLALFVGTNEPEFEGLDLLTAVKLWVRLWWWTEQANSGVPEHKQQPSLNWFCSLWNMRLVLSLVPANRWGGFSSSQSRFLPPSVSNHFMLCSCCETRPDTFGSDPKRRDVKAVGNEPFSTKNKKIIIPATTRFWMTFRAINHN